jgi:hypothetical protein
MDRPASRATLRTEARSSPSRRITVHTLGELGSALLVASNQLRRLWQPGDLATGLEIVLGVTAMALVAAVVTVVYRAIRRGR